MSNRRNTGVVANPLTELPSAARIASLPPEARAALRGLLLDLRTEAIHRSQENLERNKWCMATYWRCVGVYALHAARLAR